MWNRSFCVLISTFTFLGWILKCLISHFRGGGRTHNKYRLLTLILYSIMLRIVTSIWIFDTFIRPIKNSAIPLIWQNNLHIFCICTAFFDENNRGLTPWGPPESSISDSSHDNDITSLWIPYMAALDPTKDRLSPWLCTLFE